MEFENEMLLLGVYSLVVRGCGTDTLMGKNVRHSMQLTGLESLLRRFIADLDQQFAHIYRGELPGFLAGLGETLGLDLSSLLPNLQENVDQMRAVDSEDVMVWHLIITKSLEYIREQAYQTDAVARIKELYEDANAHSFSAAAQKKLNSLDSEASEPLSLLYNLAFVGRLADAYGNKKLQASIKRQITSLVKEIVTEELPA
jgi:hypothetical protein